MQVTSAVISPEKSKAFSAILYAGLICGAMDITAAIITASLRGMSPIRLLQLVASGLLGRASYDGGYSTAVLGLISHFVIAFSATTVYFVASRRLNFLINHAIVFGVLYGVAVYFFMQLVVLPLSAYPHQIIFMPRGLLIGLLTHIFCVGLPIALIIRRYSI